MRSLAHFLLLVPFLGAGCASDPGPASEVPRVAVDAFDALYWHVVGEGEDVLLVPGAAWLEADVGALEAPGRVAFCDLRGRGRSTLRRSPVAASLAGDVEDLEQLRLHLGAERVSLLGWSYEAAVVLHYALAHPARVERVVLVSPLPPRRTPHWEAFRRRYAQRVTDQDLRRLEALAVDPAARRTPTYHRAVLDALFRGYGGDPGVRATMAATPYPVPHADPDTAALLRRGIHDALGDWDWTAALADLDVPVLVVHGEASSLPRAGAEEYVAALPRARLLLLPTASHFPWLEAPASFFAAVNEFLRRP